MKVLFCNREPGLHGGDVYKIANYSTRLEGKVECYYTYEIQDVDFSQYDIIHLFHLGHEFSYKFHLEAIRAGKPTVLSPIYFPDQRNPTRYRKEIVDYASGVAFLSDGERDAVEKTVDSKLNGKTYIVPNGIDPIFGTEGDVFTHPNCPDEEFVLCVGRIDNRKNQHRLAQACKELDIPLVLIGEAMEPNIVGQIQAVANDWNGLWWEDHAPHEKLVEVYRGAKVLACPSLLEMWPNVVAQGGLAGCNLVVSKGSMSFKELDGVSLCDSSIDSIKDAVSQAYAAPKDGKLVEHFKQYTWESATDKLYDMYQEVLQ